MQQYTVVYCFECSDATNVTQKRALHNKRIFASSNSVEIIVLKRDRKGREAYVTRVLAVRRSDVKHPEIPKEEEETAQHRKSNNA